MRFNRFFFFILCTFNLIASSQLDHQYWHFGSTNRGLFFDASNSYNVSVTTNSYTPYGNEGSTVVSDPLTGVLKFYSDAMTVVDNTHQAMPNGTGLMGHSSNFSSGKGCQVPGQCNQFYVFSVNTALEVGAPGALRYSIVDMTLPGNGTVPLPKGDVVAGQKNILIANNVSESLEIVPKANSHDFWLLVGKEGLNSIEIYSVTPGGIVLSSTYAIPIVMDDIVCMDHCRENGKIALLSYQEMYPTLIADFDNTSGTFSGIASIPGTPWGGSTLLWQGTFDSEWSPDGTKLYLSKYRWGATAGGRLYQYDLNTPLVAPLMIFSIGASNSAVARGIKLAPDGKIYMMYKPASGPSQFLHAINNPNVAGLGCNFVTNAVDMGIDLGISHLFPDFLYYQNTIPPIPDTTLNFSCQLPPTISIDPLAGIADNEGDNLSLTINSAIGGTCIVTGNQIDFTPTPGFIGTPQLEVIYGDDFCFALSDTFLISLNVTTGSGSLNMTDSISVCDSNPIQLDAGPGFISYQWLTMEITQTINVSTSGMYSVQAEDLTGCVYEDSTYVGFNIPTPVSIGPDINMCADSSMLSTGIFNGTVTWSDGFAGEDNWVNNSSEYSVIAEDMNGCFSYDTMNVILNPLPVINLGVDLNACSYDVIYLEAIGFTSVVWSDASTNDSLFVNLSGNYSVTVTTIFGCQNSDDIDVIISSPTLLSIGPDVNMCADSSMLSTGIFNGTVTWSDGFVGEDNWVNNSSEYSVIAEDMNGCFSYDTIDVILNPLPVINLGPDINACSYDVIYLEAIGFTSVVWSDASTNDSLLVNLSGNYSVIVTDASGCQNSDVIFVTFSVPDQIDLASDIIACDDNYLISSDGFSGSVLWSNGGTSSTNIVSNSGLYSVIGTDLNGCLSYDSIDIFLAPIPSIDLGNDTTVCPGALTLSATGFSTVLWSDGSSNSTLNVLAPGVFSVEVVNAFGCIAGDVIAIDFLDPTAISLGPDVETCSVNEITIMTGVDEGNFLWSNGSTQSQITVDETGTYLIEQSLCGTTIYDTIFVEISTLDQVVYIPNAFTPDFNDLNNEFEIVIGDYSHILTFAFSIYDRWGTRIFYTTDPYEKWNGTYTEGIVELGLYVYLVHIETDCEENQYWTKTGHVTVLK